MKTQVLALLAVLTANVYASSWFPAERGDDVALELDGRPFSPMSSESGSDTSVASSAPSSPKKKLMKIKSVAEFREQEKYKKSTQFKNEKFLNQLRRKPDSLLRVMSWNVHEFWMYDAVGGKASTWQNLWEEVRINDPDVILMQEYPKGKLFDPLPAAYGYKYNSSCTYGIQALNKKLITFSRYPLLKQDSDKSVDRCVLHTIVELPDNLRMIISNVHLSHASEMLRNSQLTSAKDKGRKWSDISPFHVIGGDYNSEKDKIMPILNKRLREGRKDYWDSFELVHGTSNEEKTQWRGSTIDFFFSNTDLAMRIQNSYVYHSPSSDHVPIVMDVGAF